MGDGSLDASHSKKEGYRSRRAFTTHLINCSVDFQKINIVYFVALNRASVYPFVRLQKSIIQLKFEVLLEGHTQQKQYCFIPALDLSGMI